MGLNVGRKVKGGRPRGLVRKSQFGKGYHGDVTIQGVAAELIKFGLK